MARYAIRSDVVVVGHNPEAFALDNPRGEIYGEAFYVVARNDDGRQRATYHLESREQAEGFLAYMEARKDGYDPFRKAFDVLFPLDVDPEYGSPAWQAAEPEMAAMEKYEEVGRI